MTNVIQLDAFRKAPAPAPVDCDESILFPANDARLDDLMRAALDLAHYANMSQTTATARDADQFMQRLGEVVRGGQHLFANCGDDIASRRFDAVEAALTAAPAAQTSPSRSLNLVS
ncbi:MAG: hypothetical protein AAFV26_04035 [Pseudomonadota bacterium]